MIRQNAYGCQPTKGSVTGAGVVHVALPPESLAQSSGKLPSYTAIWPLQEDTPCRRIVSTVVHAPDTATVRVRFAIEPNLVRRPAAVEMALAQLIVAKADGKRLVAGGAVDRDVDVVLRAVPKRLVCRLGEAGEAVRRADTPGVALVVDWQQASGSRLAASAKESEALTILGAIFAGEPVPRRS